MVKRTSLIIFCVCASVLYARQAPTLAARGVDCYRKGQYNKARYYFTQAMKEAFLQAREDWIARAVLNLADLEMDECNYHEVRSLLDRIPTLSDPELYTAVLWKKSQYYFHTGMHDSAMALIGEAGSRCTEKYSFCNAVQADVFRMRLDSELSQEGNLERLKKDISVFKKEIPVEKQLSLNSLEALIAMKEKDYEQSAELLKKAVDYYRAGGQHSRMARSLNYLAIAQYMSGRKQEARETNSLAVDVYKRIGLQIPEIKAYALNVFITQDSSELDKIKSNLELIGETKTGFSLKDIVQDYQKFANLPLPPSLSYLLP